MYNRTRSFRGPSRGGYRGGYNRFGGWGSNSTLWFKAVAPLEEKGFTMYCLDLPGFGTSQNPKEPFFLQDYSYTVMEFIEKLELTNLTIVGHSFGGKTGIKLAAENPEFLQSLVLVDASGVPHKSALTDLKIMIAKMIKPAFKPSFMHPLKEKLVNRFASEDYTSNPALKQTFINVLNEDMRPSLKQIKKPALIIWGEKDENNYTPVSDAYVMHHGIHGSELVLLPNAGHYSFLDQPELFYNHLVKFLTK